MAQIILKDKSIYTVTEPEARRISILWADKKNRDHQIQIANTLVEVGSISKISFEPEQESDPFLERMQDIHKKRKEFLKLSPREKAEQYSWGHFKFFFEGVYGKQPKDELREKVIEAAEVYYRKNPFIDRPVMLLWQKVLQIPEGTPMNKLHFGILRKQDNMAFQIIEEDAQFEAKKLGTALTVPEVRV